MRKKNIVIILFFIVLAAAIGATVIYYSTPRSNLTYKDISRGDLPYELTDAYQGPFHYQPGFEVFDGGDKDILFIYLGEKYCETHSIRYVKEDREEIVVSLKKNRSNVCGLGFSQYMIILEVDHSSRKPYVIRGDFGGIPKGIKELTEEEMKEAVYTD